MYIRLKTILTCQACGYSKLEKMCIEICQYFYKCPDCKKTLRPLKGDCCIYCSYANIPCPEMQAQG